MLVAGDVSLDEPYAALGASVGVLVYASVLEVGHSSVVVVEVVRNSVVVDHSFAVVVLVHKGPGSLLALAVTFVASMALELAFVALVALELALALQLAYSYLDLANPSNDCTRVF